MQLNLIETKSCSKIFAFDIFVGYYEYGFVQMVLKANRPGADFLTPVGRMSWERGIFVTLKVFLWSKFYMDPYGFKRKKLKVVFMTKILKICFYYINFRMIGYG